MIRRQTACALVVDAATNKLVWESSVHGRVTETVLANLEKSIDSAVAITMSAFPIAPGGRPVVE